MALDEPAAAAAPEEPAATAPDEPTAAAAPEEPAAAAAPVEPPPPGEDAAARIDAARERLRAKIAPPDDEPS